VRGDAERGGQPVPPRSQGDVHHPARGIPSGPLDLARVKNRGRRRRYRKRARRRLRRRATPRPCRRCTEDQDTSITQRLFLPPEPVPGGSRTSSKRARPPELTENRLSKGIAPYRRPPRPAHATKNLRRGPDAPPGTLRTTPPARNTTHGDQTTPNKTKQEPGSEKPAIKAKTSHFFGTLAQL